jgi:lipoprotein NlpI
LINKAIAAAGRKPDLLDTRGVIYTSLGRPDLALADLNEALGTSPSPSSLTYLHIAQAHLKANDRRAAADALSRAKSVGLDRERLHPLERTALDRVLAATGRPF